MAAVRRRAYAAEATSGPLLEAGIGDTGL